MIIPNIDNIAAIVAVNGVDYFYIIYNVNKSDAVNLIVDLYKCTSKKSILKVQSATIILTI